MNVDGSFKITNDRKKLESIGLIIQDMKGYFINKWSMGDNGSSGAYICHTTKLLKGYRSSLLHYKNIFFCLKNPPITIKIKEKIDTYYSLLDYFNSGTMIIIPHILQEGNNVARLLIVDIVTN